MREEDKMRKLSVIVPMYNEEEVAQICYERITGALNGLSNYEYEIIAINDGSKDNTLTILKNIAKNDDKVKIISFSRNFGQAAATECGLWHASGDAVAIIDADLQDPPEAIPEMLKFLENGYAVVYGKRKKRKGESPFKLLTAKMFYKMIDSLSDVKLPEEAGDFRVIGRCIVNSILHMPERNKYIRGLVSWCGYKQYAFEYDRDARYAGKTKYSLKKMFKLAGDGIISFSTKPLKMVGGLGIFSIICSIIILIYSLISYFTGNAIEPGWTSIMVSITFFAGIQLLCLWIIAEYIARIYDNSKNRPEFIIEEKINF